MRAKRELFNALKEVEELFLNSVENEKIRGAFYQLLNRINNSINTLGKNNEDIKREDISISSISKKGTNIFHSLPLIPRDPSERKKSLDEILQNHKSLYATLHQYIVDTSESSSEFAHQIANLHKEEQVTKLTSLSKRIKKIEKLLVSLVSLTSVINLDTVAATISSQLKGILGADYVQLFNYDKDNQILTAMSNDNKICEIDQGLVGYAAKHLTVLNINKPAKDETFDLRSDSINGELPNNLLVYPIVGKDGLEILLLISNKKRGEFSIDDEFLLKIFSSQLISVIKNAKIYREMKKQTEKNKALLEISRLLTSQLEFDSSVNLIMSKAKALVNADRCTFYQVNYEKRELIARRSDGMNELRIPIDSGVAGEVVSMKSPQLVQNVRDHPKFNRNVDSQTGYQTNCLLAVPIFSQVEPDTVIAVVQMINKTGEKSYFDLEDLKLLQSFVTFATISLNNSNLYQKARKNEEKAVRLLSMFKTLSSTLEIETVLATITKQAQELLDADRATVFIIDDDNKSLWSSFADGHSCRIKIPITSGIAGYVARTGELLNIPDAYNDPRFNQEIDRQSGYTTRSILCMPIINTSGQVIAVTEMINKRSGGSFNTEDEELLRSFANDAGISLQNSQLYEQAKKDKSLSPSVYRKHSSSDGEISNLFWEEFETKSNISKISEALLDLSNASSCEIFLIDVEENIFKKLGTNRNSKPFQHCKLLMDCLRSSAIVYGIEDNHHVMCVPLISSSNKIGAIKIYSIKDFNREIKPSVNEFCYKLASIILRHYYTKPFEKEDEEILALFSLQASIAIENSQLFLKSAKMQSYLQAVLSSIENLVFSVDEEGKFVRANHPMERFLGINSLVLLTLPFTQWHLHSHPKNQQFFEDFKESFDGTKAITNSSFEYFLSDTKSIFLRYSIVPLKDENGENGGSVVVVEDLSVSRKFFQTMEALEAGSLSLVSPQFDGSENILKVLSDLRKISSGTKVLLFKTNEKCENQLVYYVDALHQTSLPSPKIEISKIAYHKEIIQQVTKERRFCSQFTDNFQNSSAGPLMFNDQLIGVLYIDGLNQISDENNRIFQVLGSLIVTYVEIEDMVSLQIEKRILMRKTEELQKSNIQLKELRDKAQLSERAKAIFLMNMSHEIRTPLNAVIGFTELLLDTNLDKKQQKFVKIIKKSGKSLLAIIGNILDLSKIEADEMNIEKIQFNLRATLEDAVEMIAERAEKKNIILTTDIPPNIPNTLVGDPYRLRQVVTNLLSNACKFTHNGCVSLKVSKRLTYEERGGDRAKNIQKKVLTREFLFEVIDTGIGISLDDRNKLFKPFSQADSSTTKKYEGTGLGLVICKRLVELMNGDIGIESKLGEGTTVWFTAQLEFPNIQKSTSSLMRDKQMFALKGANVITITKFKEISNSIYSVLNYYRIGMYSFRNIEDCAEFLKSENISIYRVIIDFPFIESFFQHFNIANISAFAQCKFICMVPLKQRMKQLNNIDHIITTPFKFNTLLDCFDQSNNSSDLRYEDNDDCDGDILNTGKKLSNESQTCNTSDNNPFETQHIRSRGNRILLAEDNAVNQKLILRQLKKVGYDADAVSNGFQAIEKSRANKYDLILMDCHMPEMDGYQATKIIREDNDNPRVSIVALTADAMQGTRDKCLAAGMDDYYTKPLRLQDILDITRKFLDHE